MSEPIVEPDALYKVSAPRDDWTFDPRPYWRTEDWSSSDPDPHAGFIEDCVLYAAPFDEINIHLLPEVWRLRVWLDDEARRTKLERLGFSWAMGCRAVIFALASDRVSIETFRPTVYTFDRAGFERVPSGEFVSREPRRAVSAERVTYDEAIRRWRFQVHFVGVPEDLVRSLRLARVDHQIQT